MARREALEVYNGERGKAHELAIHSYTHPFLEHLPPEMVAYKIVEDRSSLEEIFSRIIKGCAYPFSSTDDKVMEIYDYVELFALQQTATRSTIPRQLRFGSCPRG